MDRCSARRTVGDQLLSRRIYAAPPTQRTDPAKPRRTLQPVVPLRCGDAYGGGRQSQTSRRRDRILRDPAYLEPESLVSSSHPLCRSIWRLGARPHTLDTWLCHILLTPGGASAGFPRKVCRRIGTGLCGKALELFRPHSASGERERFCRVRSEATPTPMGRLCQAFLWWS